MRRENINYFIISCFHYYRPQTKFAKAMFLHVSVCPRGVPASGECLLQGGLLPGVAAGVETPSVTATAAGGTHPTAMHSCDSTLRLVYAERK